MTGPWWEAEEFQPRNGAVTRFWVEQLTMPVDVVVVTLEAFAAVDEPGAGALLGSEDAVLIPRAAT